MDQRIETIPELVVDFVADYAESIKARFQGLGISTDAVTPYELVVRSARLEGRLVDQRPRQFEASRELVCPAESRAGFDLLIDKVKRGDSLLPHMSLRILDADFDDGMFNDWGVHHFHLGTTVHPNNPRFCARSGPVLYAIVRPATVYGIDIMEHGPGHANAWTSQRIMQIAYDNWPGLLRRGHYPDLVGGPPLTDDRYRQARKGNVTPGLVLRNGTVLIGPGGGVMTDGTGFMVVKRAHDKLYALGQLEDNVKASASEIAENLRNHHLPVPTKLHIVLTFVDGQPFAACEDPPFRFPLTPEGRAAMLSRRSSETSS